MLLAWPPQIYGPALLAKGSRGRGGSLEGEGEALSTVGDVKIGIRVGPGRAMMKVWNW